MRRARVLQGQSGFTLVELMVAVLILVVGILGVVTMLQTTERYSARNNQRIGATNLARELVEQARTLSYQQISTAGVATQLKARGLGTGTPWTIERRNVEYTITPTVCTYDDPVDGLATSGTNFCPRGTASSTKTDPDGDDFRRVTFVLAWTRDGAPRSLTQTELIVNPSGGLGPRITSFTPALAVITNPATDKATFNVQTATPAQAIRWSADDGVSQGDVGTTGVLATNFAFQWDLKLQGNPQQVLDGTYSLVAQAFDDRNIPGEAKIATITINRFAPFAVANIAGGHNTRLGDDVDLEWSPARERDVFGYRVYYAGANDTQGGGDDTQVCPATAGQWLDRSVRTCQSSLFPNTAGRWYVVGVDRDSSNAVREGAPKYVDIVKPEARPAEPAGPLTLTSDASGRRLEWNPPASGSTPLFYRVYRGGTAYEDRYGVVPGTNPTYFIDTDDSGTPEYYVSAVDALFNESDLIGPVSP